MSVHQNTSNQMCDNMDTFTHFVKLCFMCSFSDTKNCWKWKEVCMCVRGVCVCVRGVCVCGWVCMCVRGWGSRVKKTHDLLIFFHIR